MEHRTDYIKIRTALIMNPGKDLKGKGFSSEFNDKLVDYEELFRSRLIVPINESVGLHNWALLFTQVPDSTPTFFCDIYVDNNDLYSRVIAIVTDKIRDLKITFFYKGTVGDYLSK